MNKAFSEAVERVITTLRSSGFDDEVDKLNRLLIEASNDAPTAAAAIAEIKARCRLAR